VTWSRRGLAFGLSLSLLSACGDENSPSNVRAPGDDSGTKSRVLEAGTALLQGKAPLQAFNVYMNGFHFYSGDIKAQMEAHHFCSAVNEEVTQCVIFDGNAGDAKLMGIEYIVSEALFRTLPADEKKLWHSHAFEVKSGQLVAPGVPQKAEHEFMEKMIGTYGKTWHTWHTDRKLALPAGHPLLMMGFTAEGQADAAMVASRDQRLGVDSGTKKKDRERLQAPETVDGADAWQQGEALQISISPITRPH
jgi:hypothetical protein